MSGYIGFRRVPTLSNGGGVWSLNDQAKLQKDGIWPLLGARYWRLLQTQESWNIADGAYYVAFSELRFYSLNDGSGTALAGSSFSASSTYTYGGTTDYLAGKAADGNTATFWSADSPQTTPQWWRVDFNTAVIVRSLTLAPGHSNGMYGKQFSLQYSVDDTNWVTAATLNTDNNLTPAVSQTFINL